MSCTLVYTTVYSTNNGNQAAVIYTSTGVALLTFVGTVLCSVYQCATHHFISWQCVHSCLLQCKQQKDIQVGSEEPLLHNADVNDCEFSKDQVPQTLRRVLRFDQYREPVLEYDD